MSISAHRLSSTLNNNETTSLLNRSRLGVTKKMKKYCKRNICTCNKPALLLMLSNFISVLFFTSVLSPSQYLHIYANINIGLIETGILAAAFLLSPCAGFLADVKFSRLKVLRCSMYLMLAATIAMSVISTLVVYTSSASNYYLLYLLISLAVVLLLHTIGHVMFQANVLQFGMDQLRDAPSQDSVIFLNWYFWLENIGKLISLATYFARDGQITFNLRENIFTLDMSQYYLLMVGFSVISMSFLILLCIFHKKQDWWLIESVRVNPYKLVYKVIKFACLNKVPIRRSAFTYCEDELPSRLDLGKCRYGGPFTTEQVEDVKTFLGILKVLFALGPIFFIDLAAVLSLKFHSTVSNTTNTAKEFVTVHLFYYGMLSPLLIVILVPVHLFLLRPFLARCIPNMMKRMGLAIAVMLLFFLFLCVLSSRYISPKEIDTVYSCRTKVQWIEISPLAIMGTFVVQHTLSSLCHMLLYIAAWEFICSQSPQSMKGFLFGLFYAIKGIFQWLAVMFIVPFLYYWKLHSLSCHFGYSIMNATVGLLSLVVYTVVARRYKYRKREDICNIYQYAENYYSNIQ